MKVIDIYDRCQRRRLENFKISNIIGGAAAVITVTQRRRLKIFRVHRRQRRLSRTAYTSNSIIVRE